MLQQFLWLNDWLVLCDNALQRFDTKMPVEQILRITVGEFAREVIKHADEIEKPASVSMQVISATDFELGSLATAIRSRTFSARVRE